MKNLVRYSLIALALFALAFSVALIRESPPTDQTSVQQATQVELEPTTLAQTVASKAQVSTSNQIQHVIAMLAGSRRTDTSVTKEQGSTGDGRVSTRSSITSMNCNLGLETPQVQIRT